ncbi:MAG: PhzF family phenazine biosynthesis protein [Alphaproteobacteria bacterium]|nr:MAG: PhzF family phenazine biosynthesis protein [Alphaproteobacteria bacterium]
MKFWQVDSFAQEPFKGNPAAVFLLDKEIDDQLMQNIAVEMNLSETAFILLRDGQNPLLRWFTPMFEIDLCGHATLAAAHIYLTEVNKNTNEVNFDTKFVGTLCVKKKESGYRMDLPSRPGRKIDIQDIPDSVLSGLGIDSKPMEAYKARDLMLVYESDQTIRDINPDFNALAKYDDFIIVTAQSSDNRYDFISRFFCADDGIAEDPVTGSSHCTLTPYWAEKLSKEKLRAYQASKRGGELDLEIAGDRILISGHALTVIEGNMRV